MGLALVVAAQIAINATAPDSVTARAPFTLTVHLAAPAAVAVSVRVPSLAPLQLVRTEVSTQVDSGNYVRAAWRTSEYRYTVVAPAVGRLTIPPFEARGGGATARSRPLKLAVLPASADPAAPAVVTHSQIDTSQGVDFHALLTPQRAYVGQQLSYQVGVFLDEDVRLRLRRNPEFVPPELRAMLAYDVVTPRGAPVTRRVGQRSYEVHVFERALFPLAAGKFVIAPARLSYSVPLGSSFFSREEARSVRSESLLVEVVDPPELGRPSDYAGAVGQLGLDARLDSATGRVGDPMLLTVRVSGAGNVKLFPRPTLDIPWASIVVAAERVTLDSASATVRGIKEFDWVLTPRQAGAVELPAMRYPYFDPSAEKYEVALTRPLSITIEPGTLVAEVQKPVGPPPLPLRRQWRGEIGPPVTAEAPYWLVLALAPLPTLGFAIARRPRRRRYPSAAAVLRAASRDEQADAAALRKAYVLALASRLHVSSAALTRRGALAHALRRAGVTVEVAHDAEETMVALDTVAFAARTRPDETLRRRSYEVYRAVDREARQSHPPAVAATALLLAIVLAATPAIAGERQPVTLFADGLLAYDQRDFAVARDRFEELARQAPHAPDAWANLGTAAWAAGDTAAAAVGWQRSLRLEPLATDLRPRLDMLAASQRGAIASVPPVPASAAALLTLLLWVCAWAAAAVRARGGRPVAGYWALSLGSLAVAGGAASFGIDERLSGRGLAVVDAVGTLHEQPSLAGEVGAGVLAGDIARVLARQNVWTRIRLDGDREGWIESERLVDLDRVGR